MLLRSRLTSLSPVVNTSSRSLLVRFVSRQPLSLVHAKSNFFSTSRHAQNTSAVQHKMSNLAPIVISGPSGTGKSTLLKRLLAEYPDRFGFSISYTTRKPRDGEVDGKDYNFVTVDQFKKLIEDGAFIEWAQFGGNYYGTAVAGVKKVADNNQQCILDIDMQGVKAVKKSDLKARYLFVAPPSIEELRSRLTGRGTETDESLEKRLAAAEGELAYSKEPGAHDLVIVNDDLDKAYKQFKQFIVGE
ncbi:P-loop containing nucleoside triphosphate hydrolase protein [Yarrowia lipolytica]|nr:P-loop containing nucleoside triphosphate hydrolase protein [Yarrowia lipolytica]KAE8172207.1 P-loop containing nucleoside triphosphate hydrolase protein [Yarrowia lipolytica]RMI94747.1 P-loop containing nucleoside triphosphate hydrolase protein [Yarrowia lipolytica]